MVIHHRCAYHPPQLSTCSSQQQHI
uniref:Uncharacterized protein n=1 Tax=Arundo donax TaxID=35708 RepID=A0A0A8ZXB2_ARUDO